MAKNPKPNKPTTAKLGPKRDTFRIQGDWQDAIKKSYGKKKPAQEWPSK